MAQIGLIVVLFSVPNVLFERIEMNNSKTDKYEVIHISENLEIDNNFLSLTFKKDDIVDLFENNSCVDVKVIGIEIKLLNIRRKIIDGKVCNS